MYQRPYEGDRNKAPRKRQNDKNQKPIAVRITYDSDRAQKNRCGVQKYYRRQTWATRALSHAA